MFTVGDQPVAGCLQLPAEAKAMGAPPHFTAYVGTPNVDDTVTRAESLGTAVYVPPMDIPTIGRFAVLADPQGAVQALFQPAEGEAPTGVARGTPGSFVWYELMTDDQKAAFEYYSALFGWIKTEAMDMGDMGTYQMYGKFGETYGGMMTKPTGLDAPSSWMYYISVANLDESIAKLVARGSQVINGPMDVPDGGRVTQCIDPQGAAVAFHQGMVVN
jgi:uncharacterized protein